MQNEYEISWNAVKRTLTAQNRVRWNALVGGKRNKSGKSYQFGGRKIGKIKVDHL